MSGIRLAGIARETPALCKSLDELAAEGLLRSSIYELRNFGFAHCRVSDVPASELGLRAVKRLLADTGTAPASVQLLVSASAMPTSMVVPRDGALSMLEAPRDELDLSRYGSTRLQHELGLENATVLGVAETGCAALLSAVWLAQCVMEREGLDTAVCVNADVMPRGLKREVLYSVMSDAGCAVLLRRGEGPGRLLAHAQTTKGYYWDGAACHNELLAAYYPIGKRLIDRTLRGLGLTLADIACVLPNNVSLLSWQAMSRVLRLPLERVYTDNIARMGHAMGSDSFINLADALAEGRLARGDRVLLFGFGVGAHWACSVVEI